MGCGGIEVVKDVVDMVLIDDDFVIIEVVVEEGCGVFDNLIKFIIWMLFINFGEGLVIVVVIVVGVVLLILFI